MTFPRGPRGVQLTKLVLDIDVGRVARRAAACIAALVLAAATAGGEPRGALNLPAGWSIERNELVWTSATPLRMGGARYEFRSGDQLLGYPATRGNALRLPLRSFGSLAELSVWAGGRRIDAGAQQLRVLAETPIAEPEIAQAAADPAAPGPYRAQRLRYTLPGLALEGYAGSGRSGRGGDCSDRRARRAAARSLSPRTAQHLLSRRPRRRGVGRLALPDGMAPGPEPHRIPVHHRRARHSGIPGRVDFRERNQRSGRPVHRRGRVGALTAGPPPSRPVVGLEFRRWRPLGRALSWPRRHG